MTTDKTAVDWIQIEVDFRAGIKPLRLIGEENGITHGAINKRAKRDGWVRDLGAKIRAQADAKVSKAAVSGEVRAHRMVTERQVVDSNVDLQVSIRLSHRTDIQRVKSLLLMLLAEAEHQGANVALYQELGEVLAAPDEKGQDKLGEIYRKAMSLPSRVGVLKQITETLALLIKLEREAFGIDNEKNTENPMDTALKQMAEWKKANGR